MKKAIAFLIVAILQLSAMHGAAAEKGGPSQEVSASVLRLQNLADEYSEEKSKLNKTETEKRRVLGALYKIHKQIKRVTQKKGRLTDRLLRAQSSVKEVAEEIASLETQIKERHSVIRNRIRVLYKMSGHNFLRLVFSSRSAGELDRDLKFLKIVTDKDYRLLKEHHAQVAELREKHEVLNQEVARLAALENQVKQSEKILIEQQTAQSRLISKLDRFRNQQLNRISGLRKKTKAIASQMDPESGEIDELFRPSFFEERGRLPTPVDGIVKQSFGLIRDPVYNTQTAHKGWFIASVRGTEVQSVFPGVVVFSDWLSGYGKTVIVEHGHNYYTVYSHLDEITVGLDDEIQRNQIIGSVGGTSMEFGDGIYFEIRHFSQPEDPQKWLNSKGIQISSVKEAYQ